MGKVLWFTRHPIDNGIVFFPGFMCKPLFFSTFRVHFQGRSSTTFSFSKRIKMNFLCVTICLFILLKHPAISSEAI